MKTHFWRLALMIIAICGTLPVEGKVITTIAGDGSFGFSGDGGPASDAQFNSELNGSGLPVGVDSFGNIYIVDVKNHAIRAIRRSWDHPEDLLHASSDIITIAGTGIPGNVGDGGLATAAQLNYPKDLAVGRNSNASTFSVTHPRNETSSEDVDCQSGWSACGISFDKSEISGLGAGDSFDLTVSATGMVQVSDIAITLQLDPVAAFNMTVAETVAESGIVFSPSDNFPGLISIEPYGIDPDSSDASLFTGAGTNFGSKTDAEKPQSPPHRTFTALYPCPLKYFLKGRLPRLNAWAQMP